MPKVRVPRILSAPNSPTSRISRAIGRALESATSGRQSARQLAKDLPAAPKDDDMARRIAANRVARDKRDRALSLRKTKGVRAPGYRGSGGRVT